MQGSLAAEQAKLARDPSYQFDFLVVSPPKPPAWLKWLEPLAKIIGPAAPYLFWGSLIAVVATLAFFIARELWRTRGGGVGKAKVLESAGFAPSRGHVKALLEDADRLAAAGEFGEAARVILHRTLDDLAERKPGLISPAQTAREIATLRSLPTAMREPLAGIAGSVERFLFAGHVLTRETFELCRADYDRFLAAAGRS